MRILLVEDDAGIVSNLTEFLHGEGFAVEAAAGQTEAQEKLEQGTYDLILLDVSLREGNGFAVCSYVRENTDIPVIFLTASGDEYSVVARTTISANRFGRASSCRGFAACCAAGEEARRFWKSAAYAWTR